MARNNSKTADEVQIRQLIDCWAGGLGINRLDPTVGETDPAVDC
jgi:hypothetical protein